MHSNHEDIQEEMKKMGNFDFEAFKMRNKDLKNKTKSGPSQKASKEDMELLDEDTMKKLDELINKDPDSKKFHKINNQEEEFIKVEEEKNVLVHRPLKNFVWGLGQQTKQKKCKNYLTSNSEICKRRIPNS
jgi:hypothetical protein